jgi:hypothetical protein
MKQTTDLTTKTLATTIDALTEGLDALKAAYADLAWPETDDEPVDWIAVMRNVDRLGRASQRLGALAADEMIPVLKTLKALARQRVAEIERLDQLVTLSPHNPPNTFLRQETLPP